MLGILQTVQSTTRTIAALVGVSQRRPTRRFFFSFSFSSSLAAEIETIRRPVSMAGFHCVVLKKKKAEEIEDGSQAIQIIDFPQDPNPSFMNRPKK